MKKRIAIAGIIGIYLIAILSAAFIPHFGKIVAQVTVTSPGEETCKEILFRSKGYWNNHPQFWEALLPQTLGNEVVNTTDRVDQIFERETKIDKVKAPLLAIKFNLVNFPEAANLSSPRENITIGALADQADALLMSGNATNTELTLMKDRLERITGVLKDCPDEEDDDDDEHDGDEDEKDKVTICHIPPGNSDKSKTITIEEEDVAGHLGHGDTLGACKEDKENENEDKEDNEDENETEIGDDEKEDDNSDHDKENETEVNEGDRNDKDDEEEDDD